MTRCLKRLALFLRYFDTINVFKRCLYVLCASRNDARPMMSLPRSKIARSYFTGFILRVGSPLLPSCEILCHSQPRDEPFYMSPQFVFCAMSVFFTIPVLFHFYFREGTPRRMILMPAADHVAALAMVFQDDRAQRRCTTVGVAAPSNVMREA